MSMTPYLYLWQGDVDADLFLIKYLLILREQITPFDIDFTVTNKSLDFTSTSGMDCEAAGNLMLPCLMSYARGLQMRFLSFCHGLRPCSRSP